jgi:hypothetical protein
MTARLTFAFILTTFVLISSFSAQAATSAYKIYLSPTGNDSNAGTTSKPVKTLGRAQRILQSKNPQQPVEIHIGKGTYYGQTVQWGYANGHPITFLPANYSADRPVFDGKRGRDFFELMDTRQAKSLLQFKHLKVQNYNHALILRDDGNLIDNMIFDRIGSSYSDDPLCGTTKASCGAVRLIGSNYNKIINSKFSNVLNPVGQMSNSLIHAVYLWNGSSHNEVDNNQFINVDGDVIRARDGSNYNLITNNSFAKAGQMSVYSEWHRDYECPSYGNEFKFNDISGGYFEDISITKLYVQYPLASGCTARQDKWVTTEGNVRHD